MPAQVVFIDSLPSNLRELVKTYAEPIACYWTREVILDKLFGFCSKDYYSYDILSHAAEEEEESTLLSFADKCLDWVNCVDEASEIDTEIMFLDVVASNYIRVSDDQYLSTLEKDVAMQWLDFLVQDAIASNQPLPIE